MKYVKMLGLAAIAAAALMAFVGAGTASATLLTGTGCAEAGCAKGTSISSTSEGKAVLDSPIGNIECESEVAGTTSNAGGTGTAVEGNIETLSFTNCNSTVVVEGKGTLKIVGEAGNKGDLFSTGAKVTVEKSGFHCIFETSNTTIGTVTGGTTATLDISANIPRVGGRSGIFCGSSSPWTGSYKVNTPDTLNIDQ